jgi:F420-dependent oxidoreductase-like protein
MVKTVTSIGLQLPYFGKNNEVNLAQFLESTVESAQQSGFDSIWVMDHLFQIPFVGNSEDPMLEAYTALSFMAAKSSKIKLGALVTAVIHRNPALLAKITTSLDVLSNGRAILGIGASWFDLEQDSFGYEKTSFKERFERLEEALKIIKALFSQEAPSFEGKYYKIKNCYNNPRPISEGGPPILIGGSGEKKTLALVAKYADACNLFGSGETLKHKLEILKQHCKNFGRDPREITVTQLATLITDSDQKMLEDKIESAIKLRPVLNQAELKERALVGSPDEIITEIKKRQEIGLNGIIVNFAGIPSEKDIALAGEILTKAFS